MAITTVGLLGGHAEIQGTQREFHWDGSNLTIKGLGYGDVTNILDALAAGTMWDVRPPSSDKKGVPLLAKSVNFPEVAKAPLEARADERPKSHLKEEPSKQAVKETAPWEEPKTSPVTQLPKPEPKVELKAEGHPAQAIATKLEPTPAPEGSVPEGVPEKIAKSGRFIEVLEWVMQSKGFKPTQEAEIIAAVTELQMLPAVRRVRDIGDKVKSNLAAFTEAGAGNAA